MALSEEIVVEANTMSKLAKRIHHYLREEGFDQVLIKNFLSSDVGFLLCPALFLFLLKLLYKIIPYYYVTPWKYNNLML